MTEEEYEQEKAAIDSLCDTMKGKTPKEAIEIMRKGWMEELEKERSRSPEPKTGKKP